MLQSYSGSTMRASICVAVMATSATLISACTGSEGGCGDLSPITATIAGIRSIEAGRLAVQIQSGPNDSSGSHFIPLTSSDNNTIAAAELALKIDFLTSDEQLSASWLDFFFRSASACTSVPAFHRRAINNISTLQVVASNTSQNTVLPNQTRAHQLESWQPRSFLVADEGQTLAVYLDDSNSNRITTNLIAVSGYGDLLAAGFTEFSVTAVLDSGDSLSGSASIHIE